MEVMSSFYMHYESDDDSFVLPIEKIENMYVIGKTDISSFGLSILTCTHECVILKLYPFCT